MPAQETTVVLRDKRQFAAVEDCYLMSKEVGVPFWFHGKFNVFGCSVKILSFHKNERMGFVRIRVQGKDVFRILEYSKATSEGAMADATVAAIDHLSKPVQSTEIVALFEKNCNAVSFVDHHNISMLDMFQQLDLAPELCFSIISADEQTAREQLFVNVLKFKLMLRRQRKIFEFN